MDTTEERVPAGDQAFRIEQYGSDPIPQIAWHGKSRHLFWVWFGLNMAPVSFVFGAVLALFGLNLPQSLGVLVVGVAGSFVLVGVLSIAGTWAHMPQIALSKATFGTIGVRIPAVVSWLSLVGWEIVGAVLAALALLGLLNLAGLPSSTLWMAVSLAFVAAIIVITGIFGHETIVHVQRWITLSFGVLTILIALYLAFGTNWQEVLSVPPGPWGTGVLAALSIVAAGTGLTWLNAGADYTRYLFPSTKVRGIIGWITAGSTLPIFVVALVGFLLAGRIANLATSVNPIYAIGKVLPLWMEIVFLVTAMVGFLAGAVGSIYSSGLSLLAVGIPWPRYRTVLIDGVLLLVGAVYTLFFSPGFLSTFESFLEIVSVALTAWAAVFLVDMIRWRGRYPEGGWTGVQWRAAVAWLLGVVLGLLFTVSPFFTGPLAQGFLASGSFGYVFSFLVSFLVYAILLRAWPPAVQTAQAKEQVHA